MTTQIVVQGLLQPDGSLVLDEKIPMPAGRVQVTVQPIVQPGPNDPFWEMMERIWAGQKARGHAPRSAEEIEAQRQALRDQSEEEIQAAIRIRDQGQRGRRPSQANPEGYG